MCQNAVLCVNRLGMQKKLTLGMSEINDHEILRYFFQTLSSYLRFPIAVCYIEGSNFGYNFTLYNGILGHK